MHQKTPLIMQRRYPSLINVLRSTLGGCEDNPFLPDLESYSPRCKDWVASRTQGLAVQASWNQEPDSCPNDGSLDRDGLYVRSAHGVHVLDSPHHGVILLLGNHEHTGAVLVIFAVMA